MTLKTWDMYRAGNLSADWLRNDPNQLMRARELYHEFKKNRAEILEASIFVEMILNDVLCDAIVGADEPARDKIKYQILSAEFCTYHQKWKMLRELLKEEEHWIDEYEVPAELVKLLKKLIDVRNKFAHGVLSVDASNHECRLTYRDNGEKTDVVSQEDIDSYLNLAQKVFFWLEDMHKEFYSQD